MMFYKRQWISALLIAGELKQQGEQIEEIEIEVTCAVWTCSAKGGVI